MIRIKLDQVIVRADEMVTYKNLRYVRIPAIAASVPG